MEDLSVKVPKDLVRILKVRDEDVPKLVRLYMAIELYRERKVSLGKASVIAGVTKWDMMDILASNGVQIHYDVNLEKDIKTLEEIL